MPFTALTKPFEMYILKTIEKASNSLNCKRHKHKLCGRSFLPVDMTVYLRCNLKVVEQPPRGTDQASISHDEAAANEE